MRPIPTAFLLLTAIGSTVPAAQAANVELYGRLEVAVDSVRYLATPTAAAKSAVALSTETSYWGMTGSEDLGAGAKAYFKLENGFNLDTGTAANATVLFNRESYVGLQNNLGSLQLGSQYGPAFWITAKVDPFQRSTNGTIFNLMQQNGGNKQRGYRLVQNNAIQYISPVVNGLKVRALVGLSEQTSEPKDVGAYKAANVEYSKGPIYVGLSLEDEKTASVPAGSALTKRTYTLGSTYDFGVVKLHGYLLRNTVENGKDADAYMAGVSYPIGAGTIRTSYSSYKTKDTVGAKASVISLGYTYALSKRTTLYTAYGRLNNGSTANFAIWPSTKTFGAPANGQDINSVEVGIRHFF
jgi:predicted porin